LSKDKVLGAALFYARLGWRVFPLHSIRDGVCSCPRGEECESPGKHPRTVHGLKDATTDEVRVRDWWKEWPDANIGIVTGVESGIFVIDVDPKNDGETGFDLLHEDREFPETPLVFTGGGGRHYFFRYPYAPSDGEEVRNRTGVRQGVDIRGEGGYVVAPPSDHVSGSLYLWEESANPRTIEPPLPPEWLIEELSAPATYSPGTSSGRVRPEEILAGFPEGTRDTTLFRYACSLRDAGVRYTEAIELVKLAASRCDPPFPEELAVEKVERVWKTYAPKDLKHMALDSPEPTIEGNDRTLRVEWRDRQVFAGITSLRDNSKGDVTGYLRIGTYIFGQPKTVTEGKYNFATVQTRKQWSNLLTERCPGFDWFAILEKLCELVIAHVHRGEPTVDLDIADDSVERITYALRPFVVRGQPNVIFGDRSSGKSYLGVLVAYLVALGREGGILGFDAEDPLYRPYILDWEGDADTMKYRLRCLSKGLGLPPKVIPYRRCDRPLFDDVDRIREELLDRKVDFVLIDSLGPACGGDLNAPQPAIEFFRALRSLGISSLIVAHNAKGKGPKSVFGSSFFENLARSIWEIRTDNDDEKIARMGAIHRKANFSGLNPPLGFEFRFDDVHGETTIRRTDVRELVHAQGALHLTTRILDLLSDAGKMKSPEIAHELGEDPNKVRATLNHMKRQDRVGKEVKGGRWFLIAEEPTYGIPEEKEERLV